MLAPATFLTESLTLLEDNFLAVALTVVFLTVVFLTVAGAAVVLIALVVGATVVVSSCLAGVVVSSCLAGVVVSTVPGSTTGVVVSSTVASPNTPSSYTEIPYASAFGLHPVATTFTY